MRAGDMRARKTRAGMRRLARAIVRVPRATARVLRAAAWVILPGALLGCSAAAPPANPEYPALVLPAQLPSQPPARPSPSSAPAASAAAARSAGGVPNAAPSPASPPSLIGAASARAASEPASASALSPHGDLPDPPPLSERAQWSYPVAYDRGTIRVGEPEPMCLPRPQPTPRRIGRFAFELWLGRELVDRVRFDFPLLANEEPPAGPRRPLREPPRFAPGARVSITLRVPDSERAATARILDRATGESIAVPWPPRSSDGARPRPCPSTGPRASAAPRAATRGAPSMAPASTDAGR
jgi:hypothetical protein